MQRKNNSLSSKHANSDNQRKVKNSNSVKSKTTAFTFRVLFAILFYMVAVIFVFKMAHFAYKFAYPIFGNGTVSEAPGQSVKFTVSEDESLDAVIDDLYSKGLIINKQSFKIRCKLSLNSLVSIQPGTYKLNNSMNYEKIIEILTDSED